MGNEMGNNNTSELREEEEDSKSTESEEKLKEENNVVRAAEDNGKDSEFVVYDEPKAVIHVNGKESEQKLIEESSISTEFQITNPLPEQLEDISSPNVMSKDDIGDESLFEKEGEDTVNPSSVAIALTRDREAEDSAEQVEVVQSEQEELDMSEPNTAFAAEETSRGLDNHMSDKPEENAAFELAFQEDSRPTDEEFEVENGEGVVEAGILKENDDAQFSMFEETEPVANKSRDEDSKYADGNSNSEVDAASNSSEPKENSDGENDESENPDRNGIPQAEEMNSVHHEIFPPEPSIENGMHCECRSSEGPISMDPELINGESEEKGPLKEQTLEIEENAQEPVLAKVQLPITVTENEGNQIPEGKLESSTDELLETEVLPFDVQSNLLPAFELPIEKPDEDKAVQVPEGNTAVVQEIYSKQESENDKSVEDEQTLEISEKTEPPEFSEPFKPSLSAFLFHPEDQQQKTAACTKDAQVIKYLTSESKLKPGSEFLEAEALPINTAATSIREKKEGKLEAKTEKPEIAEAYKPSFPEDQQQKTATNSQDNRGFDHSTVKLESNSQFLGEPTSPFYTLMETKPEEAEAISVQTLETHEVLTETSPENPEDRSAKSCNGPIAEISTGEQKEDEQTLEIKATTKASEFTEGYKPSFPDSLLYPEDQQQKTAANCKDDRVFGVSASEVKLEGNSELLEAVVSSFYAITTAVPAIDQPIEKPEEAETLEILTEPNPSGSDNDSKKSTNGPIPDISNEERKETWVDKKLPGSAGDCEEQTEKVKTLTPARIDNKEQETTARFSIESNPENYTSQPEMRKSPSFGTDLRIEAAKTKESEQTPLLNQNKSANEEAVNPQPVSREEKAITIEKSDPRKLKPPFLAEPKQQDKEVKDKHRRRSSLFTNCMCCTTVIN